MAIRSPAKICALSSAFFNSNSDLLLTTCCLNFMYCCNAILRVMTLGMSSIRASILAENED